MGSSDAYQIPADDGRAAAWEQRPARSYSKSVKNNNYPMQCEDLLSNSCRTSPAQENDLRIPEAFGRALDLLMKIEKHEENLTAGREESA